LTAELEQLLLLGLTTVAAVDALHETEPDPQIALLLQLLLPPAEPKQMFQSFCHLKIIAPYHLLRYTFKIKPLPLTQESYTKTGPKNQKGHT